MNKIIITQIKVSKQNLKVNESFKIQIFAYNATDDTNKRLPFYLGTRKIKT
jgi:hypothetical protein